MMLAEATRLKSASAPPVSTFSWTGSSVSPSVTRAPAEGAAARDSSARPMVTKRKVNLLESATAAASREGVEGRMGGLAHGPQGDFFCWTTATSCGERFTAAGGGGPAEEVALRSVSEPAHAPFHSLARRCSGSGLQEVHLALRHHRPRAAVPGRGALRRRARDGG